MQVSPKEVGVDAGWHRGGQPSTTCTAETVVMELLSDPAVKAGLALLILTILSAAAFFLVARLRDYTNGDRDSTDQSLLNFEEMRLKGDISEEEFRTLQAASHDIDEGDAQTTGSDTQRVSGRDD